MIVKSTYGPSNSFFAISGSRYLWQNVHDNLKEHAESGGYPNDPIVEVALGRNNSFCMIRKSGLVFARGMGDNYPDLLHIINNASKGDILVSALVHMSSLMEEDSSTPASADFLLARFP